MAQTKSSGAKKKYGVVIEKVGKPEPFCDYDSIDRDIDQKLAYDLVFEDFCKGLLR